MDRSILHCDLNAFFASVETIGRPELSRVPMAVCGNPDNRHGIILAKNEHAKRLGVKTAETIWQARKKCPDLVLVAPHHHLYTEYSKRVNEIYHRYTDQVEPYGIDESWLDVTGSLKLFGPPEKIALELRQTVKRELDLTISVGVSFCKVFAKLGSDLKKPDATTVISRENYKSVAWSRPAVELLYVGRKSAETLSKYGIYTIGDIANANADVLKTSLGKLGESIFAYANGDDNAPVARFGDADEVKSVGNGMTFSRNLVGERDVRAGVVALADTVASRLRRYGLKCSTISVSIKSPDFKTISRQRPLAEPTALARELSSAAFELICASWSLKSPIRSITITAQSLAAEGDAGGQQSLFVDPEKRERVERIESAMDEIRGRYGREAILFGAEVGRDIFGSHADDDKDE